MAQIIHSILQRKKNYDDLGSLTTSVRQLRIYYFEMLCTYRYYFDVQMPLMDTDQPGTEGRIVASLWDLCILSLLVHHETRAYWVPLESS